ncbi:MAG TPA: hypothetical protein VFV28_07885, partial [Limnobacter sp.]|nr:hypothetical protein [Limnobacter sp.]
ALVSLHARPTPILNRSLQCSGRGPDQTFLQLCDLQGYHACWGSLHPDFNIKTHHVDLPTAPMKGRKQYIGPAAHVSKSSPENRVIGNPPLSGFQLHLLSEEKYLKFAQNAHLKYTLCI